MTPVCTVSTTTGSVLCVLLQELRLITLTGRYGVCESVLHEASMGMIGGMTVLRVRTSPEVASDGGASFLLGRPADEPWAECSAVTMRPRTRVQPMETR